MTQNKKEFIQEYINSLEDEIKLYCKESRDERDLFDLLYEISSVFADDYPKLVNDLSFNNNSALSDSKIVLAKLRKILIEDSLVSESQDTHDKALDILKRIELDTGSFNNTARSWEINGNVTNYIDELKKAAQQKDIRSVKYCLSQIQNWYSINISRITNAAYCPTKQDHVVNYNKIKNYVDEIANIPDDSFATKNFNSQIQEGQPVIFLSHSSKDTKYGDALRDFIVGLGVKDEQLIYTSHPLNKIPLDQNIYDYLRENLTRNVFMIILWSDQYLESPACLNEMGAVWVTQSDYTNIYVPSFNFGNPKYHECAVDTRKMGAVLKNDSHCKSNMIELKDKILKLFNLQIDERHFTVLLDKFMEEIGE